MAAAGAGGNGERPVTANGLPVTRRIRPEDLTQKLGTPVYTAIL